MHSRPLAPTASRAHRFARTALLWLALVLALAQTVAISHAYTHVPGDAGTQTGGKHPGALAHCDACVAAAALAGGAPPPAPLLFAAPAIAPAHQVTPAAHRIAPQHRPYAIRAPPAIAC
jgi:hypothetical protein